MLSPNIFAKIANLSFVWLIFPFFSVILRFISIHSFGPMYNYPLFLARRLSLGASGRKSSPAVKVAIAAVALSVAVMMASVAVVLGFKREIKDKVAGFNAHLTLYAYSLSPEEDNLITLTPTLKAILDNTPFITEYALQATIPGILKTDSDFKGVYIKGLTGSFNRKFLASVLEEGSLPDYAKQGDDKKILISRIAANQLGLRAGDKIDTYFFSDDVNDVPR